MIRFSCSNCGRDYVLADSLAHLPLLCKGCGHRLDVPGPSPEPEPVVPPEPKPRLRSSKPPEPTPVESASESDHFFSSKMRATLRPSDAPNDVSQPQPEAKPPRNRKWLAIGADVAVVLILFVLGALVGEFVARKPTREILTNAGTAPKFPPMDLLLWLGCVGFFPLIYAWLGTRGRTLGGWLTRRAG